MSINFEKNFSGKHIIKINTKTVRELKSIAKDKDLRCYYKLKKADLVALLLDQSAQKKKRRRALPVKIISSPPEMDELEKEEMKKSRPLVKNKLKKWYDWLVDYIPKTIKNAASKAFLRAQK